MVLLEPFEQQAGYLLNSLSVLCPQSADAHLSVPPAKQSAGFSPGARINSQGRSKPARLAYSLAVS